MKTKTLIFFIDAVRPDYINKKDTPFMYNLSKKKTFLKVKSLLGFSSGIHPSIWNSNYQEKHSHFLVYSYDPKHSDFEWIKYLVFVPSIIRRVFIAGLKAPFYWSKNKSVFPKWYKDKILPLPASMDPKQAKYFRIEDQTYNPEFFEILKKNNLTNTSQPDNNHPIYGKGVKVKEWFLSDNPVDYYFVYETDPIGHYYGPRSNEMKEKMNLIDEKIKELYKKASKNYEKVNLFIFSDHGMVEVKNTVNVKTILEKSELKPVKDYIVFFDSTMVRFWVKDQKVKHKIIDILSKVKNITYLDEKLKIKYKVRFKNRKWGDLLFLAEPGYRIFPDYFAPVKFNTKGMHGYWPEYENGKGIFLTNCFTTKKTTIDIVDIMPTILKSMELKEQIPKNIDGKAIF